MNHRNRRAVRLNGPDTRRMPRFCEPCSLFAGGAGGTVAPPLRHRPERAVLAQDRRHLRRLPFRAANGRVRGAARLAALNSNRKLHRCPASNSRSRRPSATGACGSRELKDQLAAYSPSHFRLPFRPLAPFSILHSPFSIPPSDRAPRSKSGRQRDPPRHPRARQWSPAMSTTSSPLSTQASALSTRCSVLIPTFSALSTQHSAPSTGSRPPSSITTVQTTNRARFPETPPPQFARNSLSPAQLRCQTPSPNWAQLGATRPNQRTFRRIHVQLGARKAPPPLQPPPNAAGSRAN